MSSWYTKGRNSFGTGDIDWINDPILAILTDLSKYIPDFVNDTFISDIPSEAMIASSRLSGKTMVDCIARATDHTFPLLDSLLTVTAIILAKDTTDINSSPVFLLIDQGIGFPYTHPGEDCILHWHANGIFIL
jgi:hypothetical protein